MQSPKKAQDPEKSWVTEHRVHEDFPWDAYLAKMNVPLTQVLSQLEVSYAGYYFWRGRKVCPAAVYKRCTRLWGTKDVPIPVAVTQRAPFRLPTSYAVELGLETVAVEQPPAPVEVRSESVSWEVYSTSLQVLLEHTQEVIAERQTLAQQNEELRTRLEAARAELALFRRVGAAPPKIAPPLEIVKTVARVSGSTPVLADLEQRLGKQWGLH